MSRLEQMTPIARDPILCPEAEHVPGQPRAL